MSIEMLNWAFQLPLDSPADKAVLIALANHADPTGDCWPSVARVCLYTSLSERAVRIALRRLEEQGLVTTTHKIGRSSSYKLEGGTTCRGLISRAATVRSSPSPARPYRSTRKTRSPGRP